MKKSIAVSFLFLFMVAIATPVLANEQEPQKTEKTEKKCDKENKKECCKKSCRITSYNVCYTKLLRK